MKKILLTLTTFALLSTSAFAQTPSYASQQMESVSGTILTFQNTIMQLQDNRGWVDNIQLQGQTIISGNLANGAQATVVGYVQGNALVAQEITIQPAPAAAPQPVYVSQPVYQPQPYPVQPYPGEPGYTPYNNSYLVNQYYGNGCTCQQNPGYYGPSNVYAQRYNFILVLGRLFRR